MKILVIGRTGQLGQALERRLSGASANLAAPAVNLSAYAAGCSPNAAQMQPDASQMQPGADVCIHLTRADADLSQPKQLRAAVRANRPDLILIAAAYTAVDQAETDSETAYQVNCFGPAVLAEEAANLGAAIVYVSTDYVFSGGGDHPWRETDPVGPLGVYGASKLAGEIAVAAANPRHVILRTSWVVSPDGKNFVKTMLRLAVERDRLTIVDDQWGRPTHADDLVEAVLRAGRAVAADPSKAGVYHVSNSGDPVTWRGFAEAIFAGADWLEPRPEVVPIPTDSFPTPARRPKNSVMALDKFAAEFGGAPRPWPEALADILCVLKPV